MECLKHGLWGCRNAQRPGALRQECYRAASATDLVDVPELLLKRFGVGMAIQFILVNKANPCASRARRRSSQR
ncbi:MAG: hypothetical protein J2P21_04965 [Chloracidobacterium sp.]|nr:hypothetical protein [Chloracidobacterium sp.]